jgi:hypothetical protein
MEFSILLHSYGATVLRRFHRAIECQARLLRTYQPLSSKRRGCALRKRPDRSRSQSGQAAVSRDICSAGWHGWASISAGVQRGMGTTKMHRIARLPFLYHGASLRTKMCQLYGLAGCYWAVGAFQKREMKSAVVRAGSTGTEICDGGHWDRVIVAGGMAASSSVSGDNAVACHWSRQATNKFRY